MPRYINAEELLTWYDDTRKHEREILSGDYHEERKDEARIKIAILDKMYFKVLELEDKTADVEEVKHGKWEQDPYHDYIFYCSECGRHIENISGEPDENFPYCHCGARMDGKKGNNDEFSSVVDDRQHT